jgi:protein-tyrosine kinase
VRRIEKTGMKSNGDRREKAPVRPGPYSTQIGRVTGMRGKVDWVPFFAHIKAYTLRGIDWLGGHFTRTSQKAPVAPEQPARPIDSIMEDRAKAGWVSPVYAQSQLQQVDMKAALENRCVAVVPDMPEAEYYKILRTRVLQRAMAKNGNTLMVTSALPCEGKTLTSINLALTLARQFNQTSLLVDCDLRNPSIHRYLGLPGEKGLVDYLLDGVNIKDLLIWPGIEKFTVLAGGRPFPESGELLGSPRMKEILADMKSRYPDRYIIFDVPPVLSAADALSFAPIVDHVLMVVEAGKTPLPDVKKALEMLPQEKILGIVLNRHEAFAKPYYRPYYPRK